MSGAFIDSVAFSAVFSSSRLFFSPATSLDVAVLVELRPRQMKKPPTPATPMKSTTTTAMTARYVRLWLFLACWTLAATMRSTVALPTPPDGGPAGACPVMGKVGGGAPPPVGETRVEGVLCMVGAIGPVCATRVAFVAFDGRGSTSKMNSGPAGPSWPTSPGVMPEVPARLWRFSYVAFGMVKAAG